MFRSLSQTVPYFGNGNDNDNDNDNVNDNVNDKEDKSRISPHSLTGQSILPNQPIHGGNHVSNHVSGSVAGLLTDGLQVHEQQQVPGQQLPIHQPIQSHLALKMDKEMGPVQYHHPSIQHPLSIAPSLNPGSPSKGHLSTPSTLPYPHALPVVENVSNFSNLHTFLNYLLETKRHLSKNLSLYLHNYVRANFIKLYEQSCLINSKEALKIFQLSLCRLPILTANSIENDYKTLKQEMSEELLNRICQDVEHLCELHAIIKYIKKHRQFPSKGVKFTPLPVKDFLHRCYIYTGRKLWSHPEVLSHKYPSNILGKNRLRLQEFIEEGVAETVNDFIPIEDFYKHFSDIFTATNSRSMHLQTSPEDLSPKHLSESPSPSYSPVSPQSNPFQSELPIDQLKAESPEVDEVKIGGLSKISKISKDSKASKKPSEKPSERILNDNFDFGYLQSYKGEETSSDTSTSQSSVVGKKILIQAYKQPFIKGRDLIKIRSPTRKNGKKNLRDGKKKITFQLPGKKIRIKTLSPKKKSKKERKKKDKKDKRDKSEKKKKDKSEHEKKQPNTDEKLATTSGSSLSSSSSSSSTSKTSYQSPKLQLFNSSQVLSQISSNASSSFQLDSVNVSQQQEKKEKEKAKQEEAKQEEGEAKQEKEKDQIANDLIPRSPTKSNSENPVFSVENDIPEQLGEKEKGEKGEKEENESDILEITFNEKPKKAPKPKKQKKKIFYYSEDDGEISSDSRIYKQHSNIDKKKVSKKGKKANRQNLKFSPSSEDRPDSFDKTFDNGTVDTDLTRVNRFMQLDISPRDLLKFGQSYETSELSRDKIDQFQKQYDRQIHDKKKKSKKKKNKKRRE